jgi:hypothetical protein
VVPLRLPGEAGRAMRNGALLANGSAQIVGPGIAAWLASADAQVAG